MTEPRPRQGNANFHTMEFAVNRRFSGKWMMLGSFGYTWSNDGAHRRAARPDLRSSIVRSTVCSATTASNRHAVELQDHRPLRAAV